MTSTQASQAEGHTPEQPAQEAAPVELNIKNVMDALQSQDASLFMAATRTLEQWVAENPTHALALLGLGISLARRQQWEPALARFEQAIAAEPKLAQAHSNVGNLHRQFGRRALAISAYRKAVQLQPGLAEAHYNLSIVLDEDGKPEAAEDSVRRALLFRPNYPEAHNNLGNLLLKAGKVDAAVSHFRQALAWNEVLRPARFNLILALYRLGRSAEAQAEVGRLLKEYPDDPHILRVQAAGLAQQGSLGEAERINRQLLDMQPDAPDLWLHQGEVLMARKDFDGAMALYKELSSKHNLPPAVSIGAMAQVMLARGNYGEARQLYQQALMMDGRMPSLLMGLARTLLESGDSKLGLETLRRVLEIAPAAADVHSLLIHHLRLDPAVELDALSAEQQRWSERHAPTPAAQRPPALARKAGDSLRVGFLVGDTESGPAAASLMAWLKAGEDEFSSYLYLATPPGAAEQTLQAQAPHWRPVSALGATDLAEQIRQDGIDILVDTLGHGPGSGLKALAQRPAPVQLSWLGDFAHPGLACVDACMEDAVLHGALTPTPGGKTMPYLGAPFLWSAPADAPAVVPRAASGIFVLGLASALADLNPYVLDHVARILIEASSAHLTVLTNVDAQDEATLQRIRRLLALREVDPSRVDVLPESRGAQRLEQLGSLDLVLDTHPHPLGYAALDCLWMGTAVLSLSGPQSWQRVTHSVLAQLGLTDWVAPDWNTYVAQALDAVSQPQTLQALRPTLRARIQASALMNPEAFVRDLGAALHGSWDAFAHADASR